MALTVRHVLHFYGDARKLYESFIHYASRSTEEARNAVGLLLWLDQGYQHVSSQFPGIAPEDIGLLADEAKSVLDLLHTNNLVLPPTPFMSELCQYGGGIDPGTFAFNKDLIVHGIAEILDGVGTLIFNDELDHLYQLHQTGLVSHHLELEAPYMGPVTVAENCRAMFITFARGQAVERDEIFDYFRHKWGDCIVRVLLEKTTGGRQPMYGRIIFQREAFVSLVLNGKERVPIIIRDREIWLRKYNPRPAAFNQAAAS